jgi:antitoxin component YwqK of YwqJK toxin-antitoxin module
MKILLALSAVLFSGVGYGQYYFNDIVATQQGNQNYQILRTNKVKKVIATSFEQDNTPTEGFLLSQTLSIDGKKLVTQSGTISGKKNQVTSFFELGKLKKTQSFSNGIDNKMEYAYNEKGQLKQLILNSGDTSVKYKSNETREWKYLANGQLLSVLKIKNNADTTEALLVLDEKGNVVEEHWKKKQKEIDTYYYYYNTTNQLTDIVQYNTRLKKLVPVYVFEYDSIGSIQQMTQLSLGRKYLVWKYSYNNKGLKLMETCFDQENKILGKITYQYEF